MKQIRWCIQRRDWRTALQSRGSTTDCCSVGYPAAAVLSSQLLIPRAQLDEEFDHISEAHDVNVMSVAAVHSPVGAHEEFVEVPRDGRCVAAALLYHESKMAKAHPYQSIYKRTFRKRFCPRLRGQASTRSNAFGG